jgi:hypothetical protein
VATIVQVKVATVSDTIYLGNYTRGGRRMEGKG